MSKTPETVETGLETAQTPQPVAPEPTITAVGGAEVKMVEIPRDIYDTAVEDNRQHNFVQAILAARAPNEAKQYVPPPVPAGVAAQTLAEMDAGRKRVSEFAANEDQRRAITQAHKNDKWADKPSEPIFRPADFVPDQRKGQGNVGGRAVAVS